MIFSSSQLSLKPVDTLPPAGSALPSQAGLNTDSNPVFCILHTSSACSFAAILGAALAKHFLGHFKRFREKIDDEAFGLQRQSRLIAIKSWRFYTLVYLNVCLLRAAFVFYVTRLCAYVFHRRSAMDVIGVVPNMLSITAYLVAINVFIGYQNDSPLGPTLASLKMFTSISAIVQVLQTLLSSIRSPRHLWSIRPRCHRPVSFFCGALCSC